jgi:hypothetical protein
VTYATEPHYSVNQVAKQWGFSDDTIRKLFQNEPGVIGIEDPGTENKRGYRTLRIPESVIERVHRRMSNV